MPQAATAQHWAAALPTCHTDLLLDVIMKDNLPFHPRDSPLSLGHRRDGRLEGESRSCMVKTDSEEEILSSETLKQVFTCSDDSRNSMRDQK